MPNVSDKLISALYCPKCDTTNVKIIDRGFKRLYRLFLGSSRCFCPQCRITWRRHNPTVTRRISRGGKLLHVYGEDDYKVIVLASEELRSNIKGILKTVNHLLQQGCKFIMLDVSGLHSFNAATFGVVLKAHKHCKEYGAQFRIGKVPKEIRSSLEQTKLEFLLAEEEK